MTENPEATDERRQLLRHTVATLAYRGGKAVGNAPEGFSSYKASAGTRTPGEILAHICDLLDWAVSLARGKQVWHNSEVGAWTDDVQRFFAGLHAFDSYLASDEELGFPVEKLFQGPVADALTHVGQIAMLRRMASAPVRGENYFKAEITAGRVGEDQSAKRVEFD